MEITAVDDVAWTVRFEHPINELEFTCDFLREAYKIAWRFSDTLIHPTRLSEDRALELIGKPVAPVLLNLPSIAVSEHESLPCVVLVVQLSDTVYLVSLGEDRVVTAQQLLESLRDQYNSYRDSHPEPELVA